MTDTRKKPSIAYIVSMRAGLEAFIYREVDALYDKGYSITLFATKYVPGDIYSPRDNWPYYAISIKRLVVELPWLLLKMCMRPGLLIEAIRDGGLVDLVFATKFAPVMKRDGIKQIHCHFGDHKFFIGYYCKRLTGLPLSVTIHAHEFYTNPNELLFKKSLAAADRIFPIAQKWVDLLKSKYSVPGENIRLNRLFVDGDENKPADEVTVLAVGRFTERKGFVYLMKALRLLQDLRVRAIFIGFGELDLNEMAKAEGVSDQVTVFGKMNQDQLRYFYQNCDILCVPSITTENEGAEGIPVVLMEGMACGIPVIATPCGAIEELVDEYLVDEHSVEGIAESIRLLANDQALRKIQGDKNRQKVLQDFSIGNVEKFGCWLDELSDEKADS
ncbi:MAG: glycosyltransferase family 4 protein [Gammaproteobacteria bacterium]|nr:glycosyltransferase family 4 protein [Gammaproteobacteria bacterium]